MEKYIIPSETKIWHVHLKVSEITKSLEFYCWILGFEKTMDYWEDAAFISAWGYHHHIGLNTWLSKWMPPALEKWVGLYHVAILYPTRKDLAKIVHRLLEKNYPLEWAADHWVSEAIYLSDPDWNWLELYWDKPKENWPKKIDWSLDMYTKNLDIENLLLELEV